MIFKRKKKLETKKETIMSSAWCPKCKDHVEYDYMTDNDAMEAFYSDGEIATNDDPDLFEKWVDDNNIKIKERE